MRMAVELVRGARYAAPGVVLAAGVAGAQVPTFQEVTGHAFGERITQHHDMVRYLERLATTSPRVTIVRQGSSWEGRDLLLAVVTAPEHHARLADLQATAQRLGDPRGLAPAEAARLIAEQPAIVWYGGSIHGFELSGSEGALKLLEHLTTRDDPATREVLRNTVILIDPMLNPDGRDAFAQVNHQRIGAHPTPNRDDWSNAFTGWQALQFRTGHYFFDTNRDWWAHTQQETRHRVGTLQAWRPQVVVDLHEMGADAEFYFDPPGDPVAPTFPDFASRWFQVFGRAYAAAFDSAGFEYMSRERYNYFYPGYTTSYGSYQGAVGMLYEQGSTRGLTLTRGDESVRTLADALEQQYLAAWTAAQLAARERRRLLTEYVEAHRQAVADGARGVRRYLFPPDAGDPGLLRETVALLLRNGIEVGVLTEAARLSEVRDGGGTGVGARDFPPGTFVVEAAQPRNRLLRALLAPDVPLPAAFLNAARARVERDENPRFYDITAWSLPLLFNLTAYAAADGRALATRPVKAETRPSADTSARPRYAYLLDGRNAATAAALWHLRTDGYRVGVLTAGSRLGGAQVPSGAGIVRVGQNPPDVHDAVRAIAERYGVGVTAVATGLSDSGFPALGSGDATFNLRPTRVALLGEDGVQAYSFGWAWYTLDRQYGIPVTVLRTRSVRGAALGEYDVIVLPDASPEALREALGEPGVERLERWVRDGGTLVAVEGGADFARERFALAVRSWYDTDDGENAQRFDVPGAMFRAGLDTLHWMASGYGADDLPVLVNTSRILLPPEGPPDASRRVIARYATRPLLAGHAWPETLARAPGAVYAYEERVGAGRVILFAEDPNFRGYLRGTDRLFLNAVVLGPSAP